MVMQIKLVVVVVVVLGRGRDICPLSKLLLKPPKWIKTRLSQMGALPLKLKCYSQVRACRKNAQSCRFCAVIL